MGTKRKLRRALERSGAVAVSSQFTAPSPEEATRKELNRRIAFLQQMRPAKRNKPRNVRRLTQYQAWVQGMYRAERSY